MAKIYANDIFEKILSTLEDEKDAFLNRDIAHLIINKNKVISSNLVYGIRVEVEEIDNGANVLLEIEDNVKMEMPIFVCFAMIHQKGLQEVRTNVKLGNNSHVSLISICNFVDGNEILHDSYTDIELGENSSYRYFERHYHPNVSSEITIKAKTLAKVGYNAYYKNEFEITKGLIGSVDLESEAIVEDYGVVELGMYMYGRENDKIKVKEKGLLKGNYSRGFLYSKIAVKDQAEADIYSDLIATGKYAKGHVDCTEIVKDQGRARAIPIIEVRDPTSHITHEAALGSVDSKELQTLMAKGLTEDEATDIIIQGILRRK